MVRPLVSVRKVAWLRPALAGLAIATILASPLVRCAVGFTSDPMMHMASCHDDAGVAIKPLSCCEVPAEGLPQPQVTTERPSPDVTPLAWTSHPAGFVPADWHGAGSPLPLLDKGSGDNSPPSCSAFSVLLI